nr:Ig-like domain-containing protein [Neisseria elongata]
MPNPLAVGDYTASAVVVNSDNGQRAAVSDPGSVIEPLTITVDAPDNTTDNTPIITGTTNASQGSIVTLVVTDSKGNQQTIRVPVDEEGNYSVEVPAALPDGNYTVDAVVIDPAQNQAVAQDPGSVDTTAPVITVDAPDGVSTDNTPLIKGHVEGVPAGSTVTLVVTDAQGASQTVTAQTDANGDYQVEVPGALADGVYTVDASVSDAAGNSSTAQDKGEIDATAPVITVDAPDGVSTDNTPLIKGHVEGVPAGSTVTLVVTDAQGASQTVTAQTDANGDYQVEVPGALADGVYTVDASVSDAAGNSSTAQDKGEIDATAPVITVDAPDGVSTDNTPLIKGHVEGVPAGSTVTLVVTDAQGASQTVTAQTDANGDYQVEVPGALADGVYTVDASVSDAAGNSSTAQDKGEIDATAPVITVDAPDGVSTDNTPLIKGHVEGVPAGSTVTLVVTDAQGASQTVTAQTDANGDYQVEVPGALADGVYTVDASVSDAAGNSSTAQDKGEIDATAPVITVDAPDGVSTDNTPLIKGHVEGVPAGSTVTLVVTDAQGASQTVTAQTDANGDYQVEVPGALADGVYTVDASVSDAAGNSSTAQDKGEIDATAPVITVDAPDGVSTDNTPLIKGHVEGVPAGSTVTLVVTDAQGASQTVTAQTDANGDYQVEVPGALADGVYTVDASVSDAAGNSSTAQDKGEIDATAPVITVDAPDGVSTDNTPLIKGHVEGVPAGSTVTLVVTDAQGASQTVTAQTDANGDYQVEVPGALADGVYTVDASVSDAAGNSSTAQDKGEIDATAPVITVDAPDGVSTDNTPLIKGHVEGVPAGSTVTLVVTDAQGASQTVTAQTDANGDYQVEVPGALADGVYTVDASVSDAAGNSSTAQDKGEIDATAPVITVDAPDGVSTDNTPLIKGHVEGVPAGSTVTLVVTDAQGASQTVTAQTDANGDYQVEVPGALADGVYTVDASVSDAAGNSSTAQDKGEIDATAPVITVDAPDGVSTDNTPLIKGHVEGVPAGSTVTLVVTDAQGASQTVTAQTDANGDYQVEVPGALADGVYTVDASVSDAAGNSSTAQDKGEIDATAPVITVDAPDGVSTDNTPLIKGHVEGVPAGSTVTLVVTDAQGASQTVTAQTDANGDYQVEVPGALADGVYTVDASVSDAAGNSSTAQDKGEIDATAPVITVDAPDGVSTDNTPLIKGHVEGVPAGSTVTLVVTDAQGASQTVTAQTDANGDYQVEVPGALADGVYTVDASVSDAAGNSSTAQDKGEIDATAPVITVDAPDGVSTDNTPLIKGHVEGVPAGSTVTLVVTDAQGASQTVTAQTDANGDYQVEVPGALADGVYTVDASVSDAAGNSSTAQDKGEIDATAPVITVDAPDGVSTDNTPLIKGHVEGVPAGSTVTLVVTDAQGASQTVTAQTDANGDYQVEVPGALADGVYTVDASVSDAAGNSSTAQDKGEIDATAPVITVDAPDGVSTDNTPLIKGHVEGVPAGSTVTLVVTDAQGASQTVTAQTDANGDYQVEVPGALADGVYTVDASVSDAAGNSSTAQDKGEIDATAPVITVDAPDGVSTDNTPLIKGHVEGVPAGQHRDPGGDRCPRRKPDRHRPNRRQRRLPS